MKSTAAFLVLISLLAVALLTTERNRVTASVGAESILYFVADSERDLTRMPSRFTRIPDADEKKYGDALATNILAGIKLTNDEATVEKYLLSIAGRLAPNVHRRLPMKIHYIPERSLFNAFAIPGGHLFVGAGLLEEMKTEDQLASVIAHEMEHVDHYHCAERLQVEAALRRIPLGFIVQIPVAVFQAGYSKEQELEADREGVLLAARSGYSAQGAVDTFELLARLEGEIQRGAQTPQEELAQITIGALTGYFRSHPLTPDRIAQVKAMIARQPELARNAQRPISLGHVYLTWKSFDAIVAERFDKAADLAAQALGISPDYAPAHVALAESNYGRGHSAEARDAHRQAIAHDPGAATQLQQWIEQRAALLSARNEYAQVMALLDNQLVRPTADVLRLTIYAQTGTGTVDSACATAARFRSLFPGDAAAAADQMQKDAATEFDAARFDRAAATARVARALKPALMDAARTLAAAEFARARFAESAKVWLESYDPESADVTWVQGYGDAAGAARSSDGAQQLAHLIEARPPRVLPVAAVKIEIAGLSMLGGDDGPQRGLQSWIDDGSITSQLLGRLAWWYVRAGRFGEAQALLQGRESSASQDLQNAIGWAKLELADPLAASYAGDQVPGSLLENSSAMRQVLSDWQQTHSRFAVEKWTKATERKPQWRNREWRDAIYPPKIAALAEELEQQRRGSAATPSTGR